MHPLSKRPGKIICVGMNYPPYGDLDKFRPPMFPVLFHKPASALIGTNENIMLPNSSCEVLYEGELAIVIGGIAKNVEESATLQFVAGFTIANDVGAVDIEKRSSQWASGKMFDTFCPIGPEVVSSKEVGDPEQLEIITRLNGTVVQEGNTSEMIFGVAALVSYISGLTTLEVGDLILTGSPKQSRGGPDPRIPLKAGDQIEIAIDRIGKLVNHVVAEE